MAKYLFFIVLMNSKTSIFGKLFLSSQRFCCKHILSSAGLTKLSSMETTLIGKVSPSEGGGEKGKKGERRRRDPSGLFVSMRRNRLCSQSLRSRLFYRTLTNGESIGFLTKLISDITCADDDSFYGVCDGFTPRNIVLYYSC